MPEITEEELAELRALQAAKAKPVAETIPGLAAPGAKVPPVPPRAKRAAPQDRKRPAARNDVQKAPGGYTLGQRKAEELTDLLLPSGAWCQVRVIGPENLMSSGLLDSVDSLTSIVQNDLITPAEGGRGIDADALAKDFGAISKVLGTYDELVLKVVAQPELFPDPDDGRLQDGVAYLSQVTLEDKAFIVQFTLGGTRDLETFRAESEGALAGMARSAG